MKYIIMNVSTDRDGVETHVVEMEHNTREASKAMIALLRKKEEDYPEGYAYYMISTGGIQW